MGRNRVPQWDLLNDFMLWMQQREKGGPGLTVSTSSTVRTRVSSLLNKYSNGIEDAAGREAFARAPENVGLIANYVSAWRHFEAFMRTRGTPVEPIRGFGEFSVRNPRAEWLPMEAVATLRDALLSVPLAYFVDLRWADVKIVNKRVTVQPKRFSPILLKDDAARALRAIFDVDYQHAPDKMLPVGAPILPAVLGGKTPIDQRGLKMRLARYEASRASRDEATHAVPLAIEDALEDLSARTAQVEQRYAMTEAAQHDAQREQEFRQDVERVKATYRESLPRQVAEWRILREAAKAYAPGFPPKGEWERNVMKQVDLDTLPPHPSNRIPPTTPANVEIITTAYLEVLAEEQAAGREVPDYRLVYGPTQPTFQEIAKSLRERMARYAKGDFS